MFSFPTFIHFGAKARFQAIKYLRSKNKKRSLIVTDRGIVSLDFFKELQELLGEAGILSHTFSEIQGNPTEKEVSAGVKAFQDHHADSIIGVGGGAALDVAKSVALMIHHPGHLFDYEEGLANPKPIKYQIPSWIAIPTTAGTGSEVGRSAVISHSITHTKRIIFSPRLIAEAVFADPELTFSLPPNVTAATGMDALTHCVEAFLAKGFHPICDGIALEGLRLISENLSKAYQQPDSLEARSQMLIASIMGAIAFQKGLGLTHSCAHALSILTDLHHGLANGVMIDHALKFNISAASEKFIKLNNVIGLNSNEPSDFLKWLKQLKLSLNIPSQLSKTGIIPSQIYQLAELAYKDSCHLNNPKNCEEKDFTYIFSEAF